MLRRLAATLREGAIVVTSDRAVRDAARRSGTTTLTAEAFMEAATATDEDLDDVEEPDTPRPHDPGRRPSREARAAQRALRRLRFR